MYTMMPLHKHQVAEDEGLWPLLRARAAAAGDRTGLATLDVMAEEHEGQASTTEGCDATWPSTGRSQSRNSSRLLGRPPHTRRRSRCGAGARAAVRGGQSRLGSG